MACTAMDLSTSARLRVEHVEGADEFARLSDECRALAGDMPFRGGPWLDPWWRNFAERGDELFALCVRDEDSAPLGLAPWYVSSSPWAGRVVRFLGSGEVCSDYLSLLCHEPAAELVAGCIADWLTDRRGDWDLLELEGVDRDDRPVELLASAMAQRGHDVHRRPGDACWRVELPPTWEEYLRTLSKSRRERVRQLWRRKFDTGCASLTVAQTEAEFDRGFEILVELHQKRRTSLGEPGCFATQRFTQFLREAGRQLLEAGTLRLQWIELEGKPVSVTFNLAEGPTVYFYQSGIDPDAAKDRPGWLGTMAALRTAIEEGYTSFDFLRGDEAYKSHWRAEPRPAIEVRVVPPLSRSRARYRTWAATQGAKQWLKDRVKASREETR